MNKNANTEVINEQKLQKKLGFTHDSANNISVDWYTPSSIFKSLNTTFDLDPCSPKGGLPWIPVNRIYSIEDDGLVQPWIGKVWLNPPYGKFTKDWLAKMHTHRNGITLVFSRTDCRWFHDYIAKADVVLFMAGRVKFVDGLGITGGSGAGCGSLMASWGSESVKALEGMYEEGELWYPAKS